MFSFSPVSSIQNIESKWRNTLNSKFHCWKITESLVSQIKKIEQLRGTIHNVWTAFYTAKPDKKPWTFSNFPILFIIGWVSALNLKKKMNSVEIDVNTTVVYVYVLTNQSGSHSLYVCVCVCPCVRVCWWLTVENWRRFLISLYQMRQFLFLLLSHRIEMRLKFFGIFAA